MCDIFKFIICMIPFCFFQCSRVAVEKFNGAVRMPSCCRVRVLEVSEWKEKEEEEKKIVVHFDVVNENDKAVMVGGVVVFQGLGSRAML